MTQNPRNHLIRALEADLIGPFRRGLTGPNGEPGIETTEELELPPSRWYLTGFLAPEAGREEDEDSAEELAAGNDETEEETEGSVPEPKKKNFMPASIGLTVFVPQGVKTIQATIRYANYDKIDEEPPRKDKKRKIWKRVPIPPVTETINLHDGSLDDEGIAVKDAGGLRLQGQVKPLSGINGIPDGTLAVSVFLVNRRSPDGPGFRDRSYVFQVEMELHCAEGFYGRCDRSGESLGDPDLRIGDLQYRDVCEYAVGHGISVEEPTDDGPVTRLRTTWLPRHEVRRVIARSEEGVTVSMETLAQLSGANEIKKHLGRLPEAYTEWIQNQRGITLDSQLRKDTQHALLARAETARDRIRDGIELLCTNEEARTAFCLTNKAMAMAARKRRASVVPEWRLFQLAFVLLNLRGLVEPTHADRERAELIFFPTGGGKTEAYLGVIACTLLLRRLRSQNTPHAGLGVTVILRYTLRLLTLDQLARAATLVCALELLRREDPAKFGPERFSVGLWVGRSATSNTMAEVQKAVLQYQTGRSGNPSPLTNCPWCDTELKPNSLSLRTAGKLTNKSPEEVHIGCLNDKCEFCAANHLDGIPVVFVDEQVYRELPAFLIGTVDKFAMIPWRGETGKLFGKVTGRTGRIFYNSTDSSSLPKGAQSLPQGALPPELIVQDELHLISGPLGTMVGLYETAIDFLSRSGQGDKIVRPKVIAATATVRRATEQMQALYARKEVCVFPPPSVDAMDTYFSLVDPDLNHAGRLYLGVAAQGRAMKAILVRVYRALIAAGAHSYAQAGDAVKTADAYTTVAGYFNSLRELGGMRRIAEDELRVRTKDAENVRPL
ncbi:MAG TPA: DNA/RNA helicase, partial [Polyangiaceae bacterium]|nr:DNA/RNA helicase [Polyangiaceae bacterium]